MAAGTSGPSLCRSLSWLLLLATGCVPGGQTPTRTVPTAGTGAPVSAPRSTSPIISAFLLDPLSSPGAVAIQLANPTDKIVDLAGWSLTDEYTTRGREVRPRGEQGRRDLLFPPKEPLATRLSPGQKIWIARDAAAFRREFGEPPAFEVDEDALFPANEPAVPDVIYLGRKSRSGSWLSLPATGAGSLALCGPEQAIPILVVADLVLYNLAGRRQANPETPSQAKVRQQELALELPIGSLWQGPPLMAASNLFLPPAFSKKNRIYARDRDVRGLLLPDTHSFRDWDAGASVVGLGQAAVHRVWYPRQSEFTFTRHAEEAEVIMTAAPESNCAGLIQAIDAARQSVRVHVYYLTQAEIADALVRAVERGVDVSLALEGSLVATKHGFTDEEREIARRIERAGRERSNNPKAGLGRVYWIRSDPKAGIDDRYTYDHSKYTIVDDRWIIVGSENYGSTGHPVSNSYGNRGWEIQLRTPDGRPPLKVVQDLVAVWHADVDPARHQDYVRYSEDPATLDAQGRGRYGPPPPGVQLHNSLKYGRYLPREPFLERVQEVVGAQLVVSPDNSLAEEGSILGAIAGARSTLLIQHLSLAKHWGGKQTGSPETTPNLLLQASFEAAKRGVRVRILLDCAAGGCDRLDATWEKSTIDNDDTYELVNQFARQTGLDLEARLLDVTNDDWLDDSENQGVEKIHNKGLIVDGRIMLAASINGVENSFKGNREVGVLVESPRVARYYEKLWAYDWTTILEPEEVAVLPAASPAELEALARDPRHTGVLLTGLKPNTTYFLRVSTFDSDTSDVEHTKPVTRLGPHESALSDEVRGVSSPTGTLGVRWLRNRSECLEGDLAGYRVWFTDQPPGPVEGLLLPRDAKKLGLYQGQSPENASPRTVPVEGGEQPQCRELLAQQAQRAPVIMPACNHLFQRVEECRTEARGVFPELDEVLDRTGAVGTPGWERRRRELTVACSNPAKDKLDRWAEERDRCVKAPDCKAVVQCIMEAETRRHKWLKPEQPPKKHSKGSRAE